MKKLYIILVLAILMPVQALAAQQQNGQSNSQSQDTICENCEQNEVSSQTSTNTSTQTQTKNSGEETQLQINVNQEIRTQVQQETQEYSNTLSEEGSKLNITQKQIQENQKDSDTAIYALSSLANYLGKDGIEVAIITDNLKNIQTQNESSEQNLRARSSFTEFFIGANQEEVDNLKTRSIQLKQYTLSLKTISENFDKETQNLIEEYIEDIDSECDRIDSLVEEKKEKIGIFSWFINLFK